MLREERLNHIKKSLEAVGIVRVSELTEKFGVTEMTIRRDFQYLEDEGVLQRIHGGAKLPETLSPREYSHREKQNINIEKKKVIAKKIAEMISSEDTVFLGAGTTIELVFEYLETVPLKIITNSIYVFNKFNESTKYDLLLIGGSYRRRTGAFVGSITNETLQKLRVKKAFIGVNGVYNNQVYTSNEEEGITQSIVLDNAGQKFIVADSSKINKEDFFGFYNLDEVNRLITDEGISDSQKSELELHTKVIY